jgi:hypothetical protein
MEVFKQLMGKEIEKLFLVVWPPLCEERDLDIDISFGVVTRQEPQHLQVITTGMEDMWSPLIRSEKIPNSPFSWNEWSPRMKAWMSGQEGDIDIEYYDVTNSESFKDIIGATIRAVELISLKENQSPFGVKIIFDNDFIISSPIADGNTVETSRFHRNDNLSIFEKLG